MRVPKKTVLPQGWGKMDLGYHILCTKYHGAEWHPGACEWRMKKKNCELLSIIKQRKVSYAGHILRGSNGKLPTKIIEGKIDGVRARGRQRRTWMDDVKEWTGLVTYEEVKRMAENREEWKVETQSRRNEASFWIEDPTNYKWMNSISTLLHFSINLCPDYFAQYLLGIY
jgi:hypothetical protein